MVNNSISLKNYLLHFPNYLPQIFRIRSLHNYRRFYLVTSQKFKNFMTKTLKQIVYFLGLKIKKSTFTQNKKVLNGVFCTLIKIRLWTFEEDCLNTLGEDSSYLMKFSFFAFLDCAFHKKPSELSGFDLLYLKN